MGTTDEVLSTLHKTRLSELKAIRDALAARFNNVRRRRRSCGTESPGDQSSRPGGTIKNEEDLKSWLALVEEYIRKKLKEGPVIV